VLLERDGLEAVGRQLHPVIPRLHAVGAAAAVRQKTDTLTGG
jgi:hypothetical protein